MSVLAKAYYNAKGLVTATQRKSNLSDRYKFESRSRNLDTAVIILAGYKQPLWPLVFPRLKAAMPADADICVMSAGKYDSALSALCAQNGWSYLGTHTNDVALVQNIAISLHPAATLIVKIDEDMFVTKDTVTLCIDYYKKLKADGIVNPALVTPMINVNGVTYRPLLKHLGLLEEYEARFGPARIATLGSRATDDPIAAQWIWERTAPLEQIAATLTPSSELLMAPVQFSIGLIVFEREFWEAIGLLPVKRHMLAMKQSTLGVDEDHLCRLATSQSRPVVICQHAIAGHFSFGRQYSGMLGFLGEHPEYFAEAGDQ